MNIGACQIRPVRVVPGCREADDGTIHMETCKPHEAEEWAVYRRAPDGLHYHEQDFPDRDSAVQYAVGNRPLPFHL